MSGDSSINNYTVGNLIGGGNIGIDILYGTTVTSDTITATSSSGVVTITSINEYSGTRPRDFNIQVIKGGSATLAVTDTVKEQFKSCIIIQIDS